MLIHLSYPLRDLMEDSKVVEKAIQKAMEMTPNAASAGTTSTKRT